MAGELQSPALDDAPNPRAQVLAGLPIHLSPLAVAWSTWPPLARSTTSFRFGAEFRAFRCARRTCCLSSEPTTERQARCCIASDADRQVVETSNHRIWCVLGRVVLPELQTPSLPTRSSGWMSTFQVLPRLEQVLDGLILQKKIAEATTQVQRRDRKEVELPPSPPMVSACRW